MKLTRPVILNEVKDPVSFSPASILLDSSASPQNDRHRGFVRLFVPLLLALSSLLSAPCSKATEPAVSAVERLTDLGQGLSYLRIRSLADSEGALHKIVPGTTALVLDLRQATASDESAAALQSVLAGRPANAPLFILVSPMTPPAVARAIDSSLTLGAPGSSPTPRVVVQTDAATDRRAYDALDAGTSLTALISGKIEKERFDEAALVEEFKNGNHDAEPPALSRVEGPPGPDPTAPMPATTGKEKTPPPAVSPAERLTDRVLQRAVHLHRALLALRRQGSG